LSLKDTPLPLVNHAVRLTSSSREKYHTFIGPVNVQGGLPRSTNPSASKMAKQFFLKRATGLNERAAIDAVSAENSWTMTAYQTLDRYARNPRPGRLFRLRRFLAVVQCTGAAKWPADPKDVAV